MMSQEQINKIVEARRLVLESMVSFRIADTIRVGALLTEVLHNEGVQSLGEVGRSVWFFGHGEAVIIEVNYDAEATTYDLYDFGRQKMFYKVPFEGFLYEYD